MSSQSLATDTAENSVLSLLYTIPTAGARRWRVAIVALTLAAVAVASASAGESDVAVGRMIAAQSLIPGRVACAACHMENGAGQPDVGIPRLAGLDARQLEEQLAYFAKGERRSAAMAPYAVALNNTQRRQVAAYFASLPVPAEPDRLASTPQQLARGRSLYADGDQHTEMQACVQCHGVTGLGVGQFSPRLAGQSAAYVADQLARWRAGDMRDPKGAFMQAEARTLSDTDIAAVAAYVAHLGQEP
ncbi:MAG: c-type cytochrome [Acetobacteraceae bacterium]|nr:c-type cytochrome [Acetobacteraceae bacterium]